MLHVILFLFIIVTHLITLLDVTDVDYNIWCKLRVMDVCEELVRSYTFYISCTFN